MFHDSIENNLRYAKEDATPDEIRSACEGAQIWAFISSLPNGLETIVGERGHRLSGGERQRLAIARLLLKSPSIVILDEATAHLDSENEALVQTALEIALQGRTSIVIAHRLSTIQRADQILVLESGRIVERGRHEELVAQRGLYFDLYQRQVLTAST
jgi:ATP-binding cassette subfamily B protein